MGSIAQCRRTQAESKIHVVASKFRVVIAISNTHDLPCCARLATMLQWSSWCPQLTHLRCMVSATLFLQSRPKRPPGQQGLSPDPAHRSPVSAGAIGLLLSDRLWVAGCTKAVVTLQQIAANALPFDCHLAGSPHCYDHAHDACVSLCPWWTKAACACQAFATSSAASTASSPFSATATATSGRKLAWLALVAQKPAVLEVGVWQQAWLTAASASEEGRLLNCQFPKYIGGRCMPAPCAEASIESAMEEALGAHCGLEDSCHHQRQDTALRDRVRALHGGERGARWWCPPPCKDCVGKCKEDDLTIFWKQHSASWSNALSRRRLRALLEGNTLGASAPSWLLQPPRRFSGHSFECSWCEALLSKCGDSAGLLLLSPFLPVTVAGVLAPKVRLFCVTPPCEHQVGPCACLAFLYPVVLACNRDHPLQARNSPFLL